MKNKILLKVAIISSLALSLQADYTRDAAKHIVTDSVSGLMWQDDSDAAIITKTWSEAINYCEAKELGGYTDWRLPNYNEFYHLVDRSRVVPVPPISPVFTQVVLYDYWSSTTHASDTEYAWHFSFDNTGFAYYRRKIVSNYVRCVRGGQ